MMNDKGSVSGSATNPLLLGRASSLILGKSGSPCLGEHWGGGGDCYGLATKL